VSLRVAYILARPVGVSETFIDCEVRALRLTGARVDVFPALVGGRRAAAILFLAALVRRPLRLARHARALRYGRRGWLAAAAAIHLAPIVARARPDVVHAHFVNLPTAVAVLLGDDLGLPVTATAHAADFRLDRDSPALRRRLNRLDHLFVISADTARQLGDRGVPLNRVPYRVVRAAFDGIVLPPLPARTLPPTGPARLVTVARLIGKKGIDTAVEAVARLVAAGRDVAYDVYGDGPLGPALRQVVTDRGLAARITFHGAVPHATALAALAGADVAVLPCRADANGDLDGIPVFLMEAAGRRVPVVTTAVSGIPELVDESGGWLVPPGDPEALALAIGQVLDAPQQAARRSTALAERVADEFSPAVQAGRLMTTWSGITRARPAGAPR
jgi:colanic acid/amylovoran biosynthesis glycosyltransferase